MYYAVYARDVAELSGTGGEGSGIPVEAAQRRSRGGAVPVSLWAMSPEPQTRVAGIRAQGGAGGDTSAAVPALGRGSGGTRPLCYTAQRF